MAETRGTTELRRAGVAHTLMSYTYRHGGGAEQAADDLGVEHARMFKSLVARAGDGLVFAALGEVPRGAKAATAKTGLFAFDPATGKIVWNEPAPVPASEPRRERLSRHTRRVRLYV